jgi:hypothetical protein
MSLQDSGIVIPDSDEIRPARPIPQKEIDEVKRKHMAIAHAVLSSALEIGFKLCCWRDLIPHGRWMDWCRQNIPNISERSVRVYLRLWDHNDLIQAHLKNGSAADLAELPSIREALTWIPSKQSTPARKEKRASRRRQVDIEATVDVSPSEVSPDSQPARLEKMEAEPVLESESHEIRITVDQLTALCPTCRVLLKGKLVHDEN